MPHRLTDLERLYRSKSEAQLVRDIVAEAQRFGWLVHHSRPALYAKAGRWATQVQGHVGLPDLILVKPPSVLFVECKREVGYELSVEQDRWLAALVACPGVEYALVKPSDLEGLCQRLASLLRS